MRILGIDPGSIKTGFGVVDLERGRFDSVEFGCISNSSKSALAQRFSKIFKGLMDVIQRNQPTCVAIESVFYCKNPMSAIKLGEARGIAILAAAQNNLEIFEYEPRKVKQAVVGFGSAHKLQVRKMVSNILRIKDIPGPEDVTDALAVAICHGHHIKTVNSRQLTVHSLKE